MRNIIFVGGYARSGKTTTLRTLCRLGYSPLSTSAYLDKICENELVTKTGRSIWMNSFASKSPNLEKKLVELTGKTFREYKIQKAEQELVPMFGRFEGLIVPTLQPITATHSHANIVIETIGGDEHQLMLNYLGSMDTNYRTLNLNCRSPQEKAGVDIRVLLPNALRYEVFTDPQAEKLKILMKSVGFSFNQNV